MQENQKYNDNKKPQWTRRVSEKNEQWMLLLFITAKAVFMYVGSTQRILFGKDDSNKFSMF